MHPVFCERRAESVEIIHKETDVPKTARISVARVVRRPFGVLRAVVVRELENGAPSLLHEVFGGYVSRVDVLLAKLRVRVAQEEKREGSGAGGEKSGKISRGALSEDDKAPLPPAVRSPLEEKIILSTDNSRLTNAASQLSETVARLNDTLTQVIKAWTKQAVERISNGKTIQSGS